MPASHDVARCGASLRLAAVEQDVARRIGREAHDGLQRAALARAVRADQRHVSPGSSVERDAVGADDAAVAHARHWRNSSAWHSCVPDRPRSPSDRAARPAACRAPAPGRDASRGCGRTGPAMKRMLWSITTTEMPRSRTLRMVSRTWSASAALRPATGSSSMSSCGRGHRARSPCPASSARRRAGRPRPCRARARGRASRSTSSTARLRIARHRGGARPIPKNALQEARIDA